MWLKKTLSCSYSTLPFNEALQKENEKLQLELQRSQANLDVGECEVIQHLLDVTEAVAVNSVSEKSSPMRISKKVEQNYSDVNSEKEHSYDESYTKQSETHSTSRNTSSVSSGRDLLSTRGSNWDDEWHSNLLGCCSEPILWQLARKVYENIRREASCLRIQRDFCMHILLGKLIKNCALLLFLFRLACVEWLHVMSFASEGRLLFMESFHCCILLAFISRNSKNFFYTSF